MPEDTVTVASTIRTEHGFPTNIDPDPLVPLKVPFAAVDEKKSAHVVQITTPATVTAQWVIVDGVVVSHVQFEFPQHAHAEGSALSAITSG